MKICIITQYFPPQVIGGGELAAYVLARSLANRGHIVSVLTSDPSRLVTFRSVSPLYVHELRDGIAVHKVLGLKTLNWVQTNLSEFISHEFFSLHGIVVISNFLRTAKPDIIHALNIDSIPPALVAARICRVPIVATINSYLVVCPKGDKLKTDGKICKDKCSVLSAKHCLLSDYESRRWRGLLFLEDFLWSFILRTCVKHINKIVAISSYIKTTLLQQGISSGKVEVIPEMADTVLFRTRVDLASARKELGLSPVDKVVLYAGAVFNFRKGSAVLLKAMAAIVKTMPDVKLVITGNVPKKEMKAIEVSGLKKNVICTGFLPRNRIPRIYAAADVVVFPSIWPEPFGLVLTEAMCMGKPIVASKVGGITDIVQNGVNGLLTEPNDTDGLATAIITLLNDTKLAKRLSESGKVSVERYHEDTVLKKLVAVYQSLSRKQRK